MHSNVHSPLWKKQKLGKTAAFQLIVWCVMYVFECVQAHMFMHVWRPEEDTWCPSHSLEAGSRTGPGTGLAFSKPSNPPVSDLYNAGVAGALASTPSFLCECWGLERTLSCLLSKCSYSSPIRKETVGLTSARGREFESQQLKFFTRLFCWEDPRPLCSENP